MIREESLVKLAQDIKQKQRLVILTGAGMSTESGLPDFRSQQGLWQRYRPEEIASTYAMQQDPETFISFYRMRIEMLAQCKPNEGHHILAKWEREDRLHGIITQNVDGFHQQAGSQSVTELHGTLAEIFCQACGIRYPSGMYLEDKSTCKCGGFLRPGVVLFGESLPHQALERADYLSSTADLFIVLGSSLQVSPANLFPLQAKRKGSRLVIVNLDETHLDIQADEVYHCSIGEWLNRLDALLN